MLPEADRVAVLRMTPPAWFDAYMQRAKPKVRAQILEERRQRQPGQ
jgi:hypothetical protein